jgi:hypothetical protein
MIATLTVCPEANLPTAEPNFLEMLPTFRRLAHYAFRHFRRAAREDLLAEVVANAFAAFRRLVARGKAALAYPTVLAKFAIRQVREGRRLGSSTNVKDVLSPYAQHLQRVNVGPLCRQQANGDWEDLIVEDRHASPAEVATFKIDFADWLKQLKRSKRQLAVRLATGDTTSDAAVRFRLTLSRISQLRKVLRQSWDEFQGDLNQQAVLAVA